MSRTRPGACGAQNRDQQNFIFGHRILAWTCGLRERKVPVMKRTPEAIRCPQCGSLMSLVLAPGGKGPRSLRCLQCEGLDPLKAIEVAGWLKGELQPPK